MNKNSVIYPYLFAIYPIVFVYTRNAESFPFWVILKPVFVAVVITFFLIQVLTTLFNNGHKAGIITTFIILSTLSYGQLQSLFEKNATSSALTLIIWVTITTLAGLLLVLFLKNPKRNIKALNTIGLLLILANLLYVAMFNLSSSSAVTIKNEEISSQVKGVSAENPNIYYIILDGYGRSDVLSEIYGYDNSDLTSYLKEEGFYVAENSTANYNATALSLASSLNMNYIQDIVDISNVESANKKILNLLIQNSQLVSKLSEFDYDTLSTESGVFVSSISDAGILLDNKQMNEFERAIVNLTPLPAAIGTTALSDSQGIRSFHRKIILDAFDQLEKTTEISRPTFVMSHFVSPHAPFVFDENGDELPINQSIYGWDGNHLVGVGGYTKEDYQADYGKQTAFLSDRIVTAIKYLLSNSENQPIIILQSDHGPGSMLDWENLEKSNLDERFPILYAIYFPDRKYEGFYQSITPVNTFRVLLNKYFGTHYELLSDKNYFSTYTQPYNFTVVTDKLGKDK